MTDEEYEGPEADGEPRLPHDWQKLKLLGVFILLAGVGALAVFVHYWKNRPVNLEEEAAQLVEEVQAVLEENQIPTQQVLVGEPEPLRTGQAVWKRFEVDVLLQPGINPTAVARILKRELDSQQVTLKEEPGLAEGTLDVHLLLMGFDVATVKLQAAQPTLDRPDAAAAAQPVDVVKETNRVQNQVRNLLVESGVPAKDITFEAPKRRRSDEFVWAWIRMQAVVPPSTDLAALVENLETASLGTDIAVESGPSPGDGDIRVDVSYDGLPVMELLLFAPAQTPGLTEESRRYKLDAALPELAELPLESAFVSDQNGVDPAEVDHQGDAKVAIIVDDGGYGGPASEQILAIDAPLTLAILPFTPQCADIARRGADAGFEVMLHMPMESFNGNIHFPGSIETDMDAGEIRAKTERALAEVPGAKGVNNHTGSAFTANTAAMEVFLDVLGEKSLYFVDSRTDARTIAYQLALEKGMDTLERDVFLDNEADESYIRGQFDKLVAAARQRGMAVGICHFRPATAQVLTHLVPELQSQGIEIVPVSALLSITS